MAELSLIGIATPFCRQMSGPCGVISHDAFQHSNDVRSAKSDNRVLTTYIFPSFDSTLSFYNTVLSLLSTVNIKLYRKEKATMASAAIQQTAQGHSTTFEPLHAKTELATSAPKSKEVHDVPTQLNYYKDPGNGSEPAPAYVGKPETYERPYEPLDVVVQDIRGREDQFTLDKHGFQIYRHESKEKDFTDDVQIKSAYYAETEQLLKDAYVTVTVLLLLPDALAQFIANPASPTEPAHPAYSSSTTLSAALPPIAPAPPHPQPIHSVAPSPAYTSTNPTLPPKAASRTIFLRMLTPS